MIDRTSAPLIKDAIEFDLKLKPYQKMVLNNGVEVYAINAGEQELLQLEIVFYAGNSYEANNLSVWPVPASNMIAISGLNGFNHNIEVFDETGRMVKQVTLIKSKEVNVIDVAALENGIYYMRAVDDLGSQKVAKFVVMH